jgi:hypothetical protein
LVLVREGATLPLAGEPCAIEGVGREGYVYALVSGLPSSARTIGEPVSVGEPVVMIDGTLGHPLRGYQRTHGSGVSVQRNDKIVEVDLRPSERTAFKGLGERSRQIGYGVEKAIYQMDGGLGQPRRTAKPRLPMHRSAEAALRPSAPAL